MKRTGPSRGPIIFWVLVVFLALLAALILSDVQAQRHARSLDASLLERQSADREDALVRFAQGILAPQAMLVDGRRGMALDAVARAADSPALTAWASDSRLARPQALLATLCRGRGWTSALLEDRKGRLVAAWPVQAEGADLSKDATFKILSAPGMGPGIVRHDYVWRPKSSKSPAQIQLVAACGVADRSGNFGGLLKVRQDARRVLFGARSLPFEALRAQGAQVIYALGDGRELYDSADSAVSDLSLSLGSKPGFDGLLQVALGASAGSLDSAQGTSVAVWQRVGSALRGVPAEDVLNLFAFVPLAAGPMLPAAGPSFHGIPLVLPSRPVQLLVGLAALALLAVLLLLVFIRQVPAEVQDRSQSGVSPVSPPVVPSAALPPPVQPGALKRLEDELAMVQTALAESHQEREKELRDLERLRVQDQEGHLALEASRRESARALSEAQDLRSKVGELTVALAAARRPAEEAPIQGREHEAARLAAVNTLSEELKATLEVIKNYINSLLGGQGAFGDAQQEFLGLVINKSARLERLIGDLVDLSEISMGLNSQRLETVPLAALVQEALVNARPQAENKGVVLEWDEQAAPQASARVDRERMGVLLRVLLSQAIKVSPRNEKVVLSLSETDAGLELSVSDMGLALTPERAAKVFAQFHGVDSQAGPEFVGAGLRFSIIRSVAEAHGGSISLNPSASGRGKAFVLSLPKTAGHAAAVVQAPTASAPVQSPLGKFGSPLPVLPKLPPPGLPPMAGPAPVVGLASLPTSLPPPPPPPVAPRSEAEKRPASAAAHKPAPLDETFNAPWKRKDAQLSDDLDELMNLSGLPAAPKPLPQAPSSAVGPLESVPSPPPPFPGAPKPSLGAAGVDFDALFGPPPTPPVAPSGGSLDTMDDLNKLLGQ